uniref:RNA-directed DNA polymerase from mobile element jockey-like n=1 Tax=Cacopsylla melanoneura TaxID=428564 RepID=A0A8D8YGY2_9HEMI
MNKILIWLYKKEIFLNKEKTRAILFENPLAARYRRKINKNIQIHENKCLDGKTNNNCTCKRIENEKTIKYLGIQFDKNLKWTSQTTYIKNKLNCILHKIQNTKKILPTHIKAMMYKTLCESVMRYGLEVYGFTTQENLKPILSVQKKIIKATFYPKTTKNKRQELTKKFKILNFKNLHRYVMLNRYYYEENYRKRMNTPYSTRNNNYILPKVKNKYGETTAKYQIPKVINELPTK